VGLTWSLSRPGVGVVVEPCASTGARSIADETAKVASVAVFMSETLGESSPLEHIAGAEVEIFLDNNVARQILTLRS
jgi:hypothetical protein